MVMRKRVVIIQRWMTHYRLPLFESLRSELDRIDIDLDVVHGDPPPSEGAKHTDGSLPWARTTPIRYWTIGKTHVSWQSMSRELRGADMVIATAENAI